MLYFILEYDCSPLVKVLGLPNEESNTSQNSSILDGTRGGSRGPGPGPPIFYAFLAKKL